MCNVGYRANASCSEALEDTDAAAAARLILIVDMDHPDLERIGADGA